MIDLHLKLSAVLLELLELALQAVGASFLRPEICLQDFVDLFL